MQISRRNYYLSIIGTALLYFNFLIVQFAYFWPPVLLGSFILSITGYALINGDIRHRLTLLAIIPIISASFQILGMAVSVSDLTGFLEYFILFSVLPAAIPYILGIGVAVLIHIVKIKIAK